MTFGHKLLFYDVNLILNDNKAYALVGANGCGKSTFFKLITGEEEPSSGEIVFPKAATIGWLKQDQFKYEDTPIQDIVLQGKLDLWQALQEKEQLLLTDNWDDKKGLRFGELEEIIFHYDGYNALNEIESILTGLGILPEFHSKPLESLSGGYKLRVLLARALFQKPSILLLDEPTNHLDIVSIKWLEEYLKSSFNGLLIFISHDVDFIDNVATDILDIDFGEIRKYPSKYNKFLAEKSLLQEQKLVERKSAEAKVEHLQKFVDRFGAKASKATLARSRMKMIEKTEIPDIVNSSRISPNFKFIPEHPSAKLVCKIESLSKSFKDKELFTNFNYEVKKNDKIAILGINGRGKSTLIKILMNLIHADNGSFTWGSNVKASYFSQDHHDLLKQSISAIDWLHENITKANDQQIRKMLGQMLFTKDDAHKNILSLSGGEAARLLLAKVMLDSPNLLILDEPTNHLDLETIEVLADALAKYQGTILFVSHNRHFTQKIANRILYFTENKGLKDFKGKYSEFIAS